MGITDNRAVFVEGPLEKEVLLNERNDQVHNCFLNGLGQKQEKEERVIVFRLNAIEEGFLSRRVT